MDVFREVLHPIILLVKDVEATFSRTVPRIFVLHCRSVYFPLLFHFYHLPYLVLVFVFNCSLGNRYF